MRYKFLMESDKMTVKNAYLSYGSKEAPVKVEVFLNLACPYCATFYAIAEEVLTPYINDGKVEFVVKHFDKPRAMLLNGALINTFLHYSEKNRTREIIKELFATQKEWSHLTDHEIKKMLQKKYDLIERSENTSISLMILGETIERHITMVPTIFINHKEFQYPRELDADELRYEIEHQLSKE